MSAEVGRRVQVVWEVVMRCGTKAQIHALTLFTGLQLVTMLACGGSVPTQTSPPPGQTTAPISPGDTTHTLTYDGKERSYVLHIPPGYDASQPVPLVLAFHGFSLDASEMIRISGLNAKSDASGFIAVYPNGSGEQKSWNGGRCCGEAARSDVDDVRFVRALTEELSTFLNIDAKRIYATGFSNGAIMVYRLACEMSDQIAAIGPVSATQALEDLEACQPARPVPVIHFHGTDDDPNPYDGLVTPGGVRFVSVAEAIRFWVEFNGCPPEPQRSESGSIIHERYDPCQLGVSVELYTIVGGKHAWPGGEAVNPRMGEPTMEISATDLMWEFFSSHPMP